MSESSPSSLDIGLPSNLPERVYTTWIGALTELHTTESARHAAERYQFLCGFAQALTDSGFVADGDYAAMRERLMQAWVSAVNRVDQNSSTTVPSIY